jgi:hypothetical protein
VKALYEIEYTDKTTGRLNDTRRVVKANNNTGFRQAYVWAFDHCEKHEQVTSVKQVATERL